jgi:hypothetical protein
MNILDQLIQLANKLDQKGLYSEATLLDKIIKESEGYRELLGPGIMGPEDPTRMGPGGGAGGLPAYRPPQPSPEGIAGKDQERVTGPRLDFKVLEFQKDYNKLYDQLAQLGTLHMPALGRRLREDAIRGPKTRRAEKLMPRMQAMLANEMRTRSEPEVGIAGKGPRERQGPSARRERVRQSMHINNAANRLKIEVERAGKRAGSPQQIANLIFAQMKTGKSLRQATDAVRLQLMGA